MTNYRASVMRTGAAGPGDLRGKLSLGALGLAGEAGEVVDLIKKVIFHSKPMDREHLIKELGDVRWYLEYIAEAIGVSMEEIEQLNIAKLEARYPNGFNTTDANARRDERASQTQTQS